MGDFFGEIEEVPFNVCGQIADRFVIETPIDDVVKRDFSAYSCFDSTHPESSVLLLFPRHDVQQNRRNTTVHRMLRVLAVTKNRSVHFPQLVMAGKLPQLVFGCDAEQAFERDPEWPDRPAALIEINPTFLAALPCLSPNNALPVEMALHVAVGVFRALAALHRAGFVHRLVTPYSFTVPFPLTVDAIQRNVTIFDFSHVLPFPIKPRAHVPFVGTFRYSSVRAHYGREQGPSDDVISLIYMVAEFISGRLPWRSVRDEPTIVSLKKDFHRTDCFRRLPREFRNLYREMNLMPGPAMIEHASILSKMQFSLARRESPLKKTLPHFVNTEVLSKELLENRRKRKAAKN